MAIEFDAAKDRENIRKHGISLARAEHFDMQTAVVAVDDSQDYGEIRYIAIGWLDGRLHIMCFAFREENSRIINLRKAGPSERKTYADSHETQQ